MEYKHRVLHAIHTGQFRFEQKRKAAAGRDERMESELAAYRHVWFTNLMAKLPDYIQTAEGEGKHYITYCAAELPYKMTARKACELYQMAPYYVPGILFKAVHGERPGRTFNVDEEDLEITWDALREEAK